MVKFVKWIYLLEMHIEILTDIMYGAWNLLPNNEGGRK